MKAKSDHFFSVIIASYNRPNEIASCLKSIINNNYKNYEIIIIDQSDDQQTRDAIRTFQDKRIVHYKQNNKNKSLAINYGITKSCGDVIAITDDDCLVGRNWLSRINQTYKLHPSIAAVTGKVIPANGNHDKNFLCPSYFLNNTPNLINKPCYHSTAIGMGNNFSFTKRAFRLCGPFKTWLGPGSALKDGEDAEYMMRLLVGGHQIYYNPDIIVCHDRWISPAEHISQNLDYILGESVCYAYYLCQFYSFALPIVLSGILLSFKDILLSVVSLLRLKRAAFQYHLLVGVKTTAIRTVGLLSGLYYAIKDPLRLPVSST